MADTDEKPDVQPVLSPRDQAIESMADSAFERHVAGGLEDLPESELPAVEETPEPVVDQVAKQMRRVKVDGEEFDVPEDDLVASYQKQATATRRLQEADRILADARAQAAQIAQQVKPLEPEVPPADRKQKIQQYHDAMLTGDMETAANLFDEVMNTGRPERPIPDVNAIIQQATPVIKQQLSNESALERFKTDYKDVMDDPDLLALADFKLRQFEAEGKPYADALISAGNAVREKFKLPTPSSDTANQPTTTRAEKLEKKGGIVNFPIANSKASSQVEREQTNSEYVAEMRKARGLS